MKPFHFFFFAILLSSISVQACSVLYYVDAETGKSYVVNNEDYWYDVKAYIKVKKKSKSKYARLWYGWDNFAQGGVNEKGLFFDAAVTPEQDRIEGYGNPKHNLGDEILAKCGTVEEALTYIEDQKIALNKSHFMFGDSHQNAVIVEWIDGEKKLHWIEDNKLLMTNFLLSDTAAGGYPCFRYNSIEKRIKDLEDSNEEIDMRRIGNTFGQAAQIARTNEKGRVGGTVYTSFIDLTDMKFALSYKLSNENVILLDLKEEFSKSKEQKIKLKDIKVK